MSVIDTLITDRTKDDVIELIEKIKTGENPTDHKGAYNASDINRLGIAIDYIKSKLKDIGINSVNVHNGYRILYDLPDGVTNVRFTQLGQGEPGLDNFRPILPAFELDGIGEVYGGFVDGTAKTITITHQNRYFIGTEKWFTYLYEYPYNCYWKSMTVEDDFPVYKADGEVVFSCFPDKLVADRGTETGAHLYSDNLLWVRIKGTKNLKEYLNKLAMYSDRGVPFQVVYEIEEPKVITLSRTQTEQIARIIGTKRAVINSMVSGWDYNDIPTELDLVDYINELEYIKRRIEGYRNDVKLPSSMRNLDFEGANQMERLLLNADGLIESIKKSYRCYSGRLYSGGGCLP